MNLLRPTPDQMRRFARRETDVRHARSFEPIVAGPAIALVLLAVAGVAGVIAAPFVLLARLMKRDR